jgi:hypothetical protein
VRYLDVSQAKERIGELAINELDVRVGVLNPHKPEVVGMPPEIAEARRSGPRTQQPKRLGG